MTFSIKQIWKIIEIIEKNQAVFIGNQLGLEYLSPYQLWILKSYGIDPDDFKGVISDIDRAYYFGMMAQNLGGLKSFKVTKKNYDKFFQERMNQPMSTVKMEGLKYIKARAFNDLSGLGNKVQNKFTNRILSASLAKQRAMAKKIKKKSVEAFAHGMTAQELASELRHLTEDWARDFSRISDYVLQEAYAYGRAYEILEEYGDDAEVYKQTFPGVCKPCEKNYGSPGKKPVVYRLDDLMANGNNIGKKDQDPVVGNAHPWARSILHVKPKDSVWDNAKNRFVLTRNTHGVKRTSKVKIKTT